MMRIYEFVQNYGLALIVFTLLTKVILLPFAMKSRKSMMKMTKFTPKMKELEARYKDDKEKYNIELQKLYKQEGVNPLGGCLWTLLPFPILIALYSVVRLPLQRMLHLTADEISLISNVLGYEAASGARATELSLASELMKNLDMVKGELPALAEKLKMIDFSFLGLDMTLVPSYGVLNWYFLLPILSAGVSFLSTWVMQKMQGMPADQQNQSSGKMMTWMGPIMSLWIGFSMPSAMSLYWIANSVLQTVQEVVLTLYYRKKLDIKSPKEQREEEARIKAEEEAREAARAERRRQLAEGSSTPNRGAMSSKKYKQLKAQQQALQSAKSSGDESAVEEAQDADEEKED